MAKVDELKEEIGWLKVVFGILTAIDISLLGWLAQNYDSAKIVLIFAALGLIVLCTIAITIVNKKAYNKIRQLKDL